MKSKTDAEAAFMFRKERWLAPLFAAVLASLSQLGIAATDDYYKGKTVRILVGGRRLRHLGRILGRHLGKQIPGNPSVVVENLTGAGGLILANQAYRSTRLDGLTIATFNLNIPRSLLRALLNGESKGGEPPLWSRAGLIPRMRNAWFIGRLLMGQILGRPGIEFDARKFEYLGAPAKFDSLCAFSKASGIASFERWKASETPVKVGGTAAGSNRVDIPRVLQSVLALPAQIIPATKVSPKSVWRWMAANSPVLAAVGTGSSCFGRNKSKPAMSLRSCRRARSPSPICRRWVVVQFRLNL